MKKIKTNPKVTVLMPVYNGKAYIAKAIESVLNQTFTDFELIIINDGSTDETADVVKAFNDPRIMLINNENQGVGKALNNGLAQARGQYIRRHDADDVSLPGSIMRQVRFLDEHPEFALVSGQIIYMTERARYARNFRNPATHMFRHKPFIEVDYETFKTSRPVIHATVLMRREIIKELGGYRNQFLTSEDTDLWLRILDNHRMAILNEASYFVRLHHRSATRIHGSTITHYRDMAFKYAEQRRSGKKDDLQRGLDIPRAFNTDMPLAENYIGTKGRMFRDYLRF